MWTPAEPSDSLFFRAAILRERGGREVREISLSVAVFQPDAASTVETVVAAERAGIDAAWLPAVPMAFDPLTLLGTIAARTDRIAIGTGIVPTYPRHPALLVAQVLAIAP